MKIMLIAPLIMLVGCSTAMTDRQIEAMNKPTLTLECETGCSASYTDPRDRPQMPTNGYDVLNNAINATAGIVTSTAPWAAIGVTAVEGLSRAGDRDHSNTDVRTDNSQRADNRVDSTHEPTVVTQPEPTVVDPVVVTQPTPVIVQPDAKE